MGKRLKKAVSLFLAAVLTITSINLSDNLAIKASAEELSGSEVVETISSNDISATEEVEDEISVGEEEKKDDGDSAGKLLIFNGIRVENGVIDIPEEFRNVHSASRDINEDIYFLLDYRDDNDQQLEFIITDKIKIKKDSAQEVDGVYLSKCSDYESIEMSKLVYYEGDTRHKISNVTYSVFKLDGNLTPGKYIIEYDPNTRDSGDEVSVEYEIKLPDFAFYSSEDFDLEHLITDAVNYYSAGDGIFIKKTDDYHDLELNVYDDSGNEIKNNDVIDFNDKSNVIMFKQNGLYDRIKIVASAKYGEDEVPCSREIYLTKKNILKSTESFNYDSYENNELVPGSFIEPGEGHTFSDLFYGNESYHCLSTKMYFALGLSTTTKEENSFEPVADNLSVIFHPQDGEPFDVTSELNEVKVIQTENEGNWTVYSLVFNRLGRYEVVYSKDGISDSIYFCSTLPFSAFFKKNEKCFENWIDDKEVRVSEGDIIYYISEYEDINFEFRLFTDSDEPEELDFSEFADVSGNGDLYEITFKKDLDRKYRLKAGVREEEGNFGTYSEIFPRPKTFLMINDYFNVEYDEESQKDIYSFVDNSETDYSHFMNAVGTKNLGHQAIALAYSTVDENGDIVYEAVNSLENVTVKVDGEVISTEDVLIDKSVSLEYGLASKYGEFDTLLDGTYKVYDLYLTKEGTYEIIYGGAVFKIKAEMPGLGLYTSQTRNAESLILDDYVYSAETKIYLIKASDQMFNGEPYISDDNLEKYFSYKKLDANTYEITLLPIKEFESGFDIICASANEEGEAWGLTQNISYKESVEEGTLVISNSYHVEGYEKYPDLDSSTMVRKEVTLYFHQGDTNLWLGYAKADGSYRPCYYINEGLNGLPVIERNVSFYYQKSENAPIQEIKVGLNVCDEKSYYLSVYYSDTGVYEYEFYRTGKYIIEVDSGEETQQVVINVVPSKMGFTDSKGNFLDSGATFERHSKSTITVNPGIDIGLYSIAVFTEFGYGAGENNSTKFFTAKREDGYDVTNYINYLRGNADPSEDSFVCYGKTTLTLTDFAHSGMIIRVYWKDDKDNLQEYYFTYNESDSSLEKTEEAYFKSVDNSINYYGYFISEEEYNCQNEDIFADHVIVSGNSMNEVIKKLTNLANNGTKNTGYIYICDKGNTNEEQYISTEYDGNANVEGIKIRSSNLPDLWVDKTANIKIYGYASDCIVNVTGKSSNDISITYNGTELETYDEDECQVGRYNFNEYEDGAVFSGNMFSDGGYVIVSDKSHLSDLVNNSLSAEEAASLEKGYSLTIKGENNGNQNTKFTSWLNENVDAEAFDPYYFSPELSYRVGYLSEAKKITDLGEQSITLKFNVYDVENSSENPEDYLIYRYYDGKVDKLTASSVVKIEGKISLFVETNKLGDFAVIRNTFTYYNSKLSLPEGVDYYSFDYGTDIKPEKIFKISATSKDNFGNINAVTFYPMDLSNYGYSIVVADNYGAEYNVAKKDASGKYPAGKYYVHLVSEKRGEDFSDAAICFEVKGEYSITYVVDEDYYYWKPVGKEYYTYSFNKNDSVIKLMECDNGFLYNPSKNGFKFTGWRTVDGKVITEIDPSKKENQHNFVLYPNMVSNTLTIRFDANGGSGSMSNQILTIDNSVTLSANKFKAPAGMVFDHWETKNVDGVTKTVPANSKILLDTFGNAGKVFARINFEDGSRFFVDKCDYNSFTPYNMTLKAVWRSNKFAITYKNVNNDSWDEVKIDDAYTYGKGVTLDKSKAGTREGYVFEGYYTDNTYTKKITSISKKQTGDVTVYAKFVPITYKFTFDKNGGKGSMSAASFKYYRDDYLPANKFTKTGHVFAGWALTKNATKAEFTDKAKILNYTKENNKTIKLYAVWEKATYTLTYDFGCSQTELESVPKDITFTYNTKSGVALPVIVRDGDFIFDGWYTSSSYKKKITSTKGLAANTTVYARWKTNKIRIVYTDGHLDENDCYIEDVSSNQTVTYTKKNTLKDIKSLGFSKPGYAFMGWATIYDLDKVVYKNKATLPAYVSGVDMTKDLSLYAVWEKEWTINYVTNGGSLLNNTAPTYTYGEGINGADKVLPTPTRDGYTFGGWYTNSKLTGRSVTTVSATQTGKVTLYAKWTAKKYTVKFDSNAPYGFKATGSVKNANLTYGASKTALTANKYAVRGFAFVGWSTDPYCSYADAANIIKNKEKKVDFGGYKTSVTLYAVWKPVEYTITYVVNGKKVGTYEYTVWNEFDAADKYNATVPGYTFIGWFADNKCKKSADTCIKAGSIGNRTFYGKSTINK